MKATFPCVVLGMLLSFDCPHPDVARTLHAGYQSQFLELVKVADLKCYPSVGSGAYTEEEVCWCNATFEFF
jgi:hypothetical protein